MTPQFRVGQGFDVHPFSDDPNRVLILGGVTFPDGRGLLGHSDADVAAHACTDALLGAAGLGDIGQCFPDTDPAFAGANSVELLREAAAMARTAGWHVVNIDCTLVLDHPKVAPVREEMQRNLSNAAGGDVSLKGKRTEGLDSLGGGIQGHAVALLSAIEGSAIEGSATEGRAIEGSAIEGGAAEDLSNERISDDSGRSNEP